MEKKDWKERIKDYGLDLYASREGWGEDCPTEEDMEKELNSIVDFIQQEIDSAYNKGYEDCTKDRDKEYKIGLQHLEEEQLSKLTK